MVNPVAGWRSQDSRLAESQFLQKILVSVYTHLRRQGQLPVSGRSTVLARLMGAERNLFLPALYPRTLCL
jgi:hypothetical protein